MLASGPKWEKFSPRAWASTIACFIGPRSKRWKLSPSTTAGMMPSREKMCSKARLTVLVPAPEEPVTATTG